MAPLLTTGARIAKGFDFLGYRFEPKGLSIAPKTLANFLKRKTQLYEQGADARRIGKYVRIIPYGYYWYTSISQSASQSIVFVMSIERHLAIAAAFFSTSASCPEFAP